MNRNPYKMVCRELLAAQLKIVNCSWWIVFTYSAEYLHRRRSVVEAVHYQAQLVYNQYYVMIVVMG